VDNTRGYARVSHSRQWYNYNLFINGLYNMYLILLYFSVMPFSVQQIFCIMNAHFAYDRPSSMQLWWQIEAC